LFWSQNTLLLKLVQLQSSGKSKNSAVFGVSDEANLHLRIRDRDYHDKWEKQHTVNTFI
jgi:hypothetical protein